MKMLLGAAAVAALLASTPALAQGAGPTELYGNVGYSQLRLDEALDLDIEDANIDFGAITGRVGAKFNPYFGVEGEAAFGVADEEVSEGATSASLGLNYEATGFAVGFYPVTPNFDVLARVGVGAAELEAELNGEDETGGFGSDGGSTVLAFGAGAQYFFDGVNGIRGDYTRFKGDDDGGLEADALSVAYVRKF